MGSVTLLFRQPVAALQILNSEQQWKWVKPQDETITINICDALQALTGNFFKSSIHRVHAPPDDQAHVDRLGVLFFARYVGIASSTRIRSLTPPQTQQPRRPRPHLQQPSTQSPRLEGQRPDQAWSTLDHGTVGESSPGAATASHKGSQDRRPEVRVRRERDGDHSWFVGKGAQLNCRAMLHESLGVNCWRPDSESCVDSCFVNNDSSRETSCGLLLQYVSYSASKRLACQYQVLLCQSVGMNAANDETVPGS